MSGGSSGGSAARSPTAWCRRARLRHQRLHPRSGLLLRPVRPEAHLWTALPRGHVSVRRQPRPYGPLARSARDLALVFDAMQGEDAVDPVCADRPPRRPAALARGIDGLRIGVAGGYFATARPRGRRRGEPRCAGAGADREVIFPEAARAAPPPTSSRPPNPRRCTLTGCAPGRGFRSGVRAGCSPARWCRPAGWWSAEFSPLVSKRSRQLFETVDAILAPATPFRARGRRRRPSLSTAEVPVRPNIGIFTQPISFIGLPVVAVPVPVEACRSPCR